MNPSPRGSLQHVQDKSTSNELFGPPTRSRNDGKVNFRGTKLAEALPFGRKKAINDI